MGISTGMGTTSLPGRLDAVLQNCEWAVIRRNLEIVAEDTPVRSTVGSERQTKIGFGLGCCCRTDSGSLVIA